MTSASQILESFWNIWSQVSQRRGGSRIFFRRGCTRLLLYFKTNKPHSFFFCRIPVVLENCRSSRGGGGAHPLHPPPRSAPATKNAIFRLSSTWSWHVYTIVRDTRSTCSGPLTWKAQIHDGGHRVNFDRNLPSSCFVVQYNSLILMI